MIKILFIFISFALIFIACESSEKEILVLPEVEKLVVPENDGIYFGAFANFGHSEHDVTQEKITDFENLAKKKLAWVYISNNWGEGITYPKDDIRTICKSGSTPFIRMMPRSDNRQTDQSEDTNFTMQRIIDGVFDKELKQWAEDAKEDNVSLLIDFGPEMTGDWFQWSGLFCGAGILDSYGDPTYPDGPERFRDAYRHIIDVFREVGVKRVTWFFHPDIQKYPKDEWNSAKNYYPGDDYIDWIGLSVYGVQGEKWGWVTFSDTIEKWYEIHIKDIVGTKPVAILEMGVTEKREAKDFENILDREVIEKLKDDWKNDGTKKEWLEDAFATIINNPYIKFNALTYWHESWTRPSGVESKLRIDSSAESLETFQRLISNPKFVSKTVFSETP